MELADMQDLGSCAARREGSNPSFRILWREAEHERFGLRAFLCGFLQFFRERTGWRAGGQPGLNPDCRAM